MTIEARCSHCGAKGNAPDDLAGKKVKCSHCKDIFAVPDHFVDLELVEDAPLTAVKSTGDEADLPMMEDVSPIANEPPPMSPTVDSTLAPAAAPLRASEEIVGTDVSAIVPEQVVDLEPAEVVDASPADVSSTLQNTSADKRSNNPVAERRETSPQRSALRQGARNKRTKIALPLKRNGRGFLVSLLVGQLLVLGLAFGGEAFLDARPDLRFDIPVRGAVFVGITAGLALTGAAIGLFLMIEGVLYIARPRNKPFGLALWNGFRRTGRALLSLGITLCVISGTAAANMPIEEWEPLGNQLWQYLTKASGSSTNTRGRGHDTMPAEHKLRKEAEALAECKDVSEKVKKIAWDKEHAEELRRLHDSAKEMTTKYPSPSKKASKEIDAAISRAREAYLQSSGNQIGEEFATLENQVSPIVTAQKYGEAIRLWNEFVTKYDGKVEANKAKAMIEELNRFAKSLLDEIKQKAEEKANNNKDAALQYLDDCREKLKGTASEADLDKLITEISNK